MKQKTGWFLTAREAQSNVALSRKIETNKQTYKQKHVHLRAHKQIFDTHMNKRYKK